MKQILTAASLALIATAGGAVELWRTSSDGKDYLVTVNQHGWALKAGESEKLYLGRDCDAFHENPQFVSYGNGRWSWANGGFCAAFPNGQICFARQELPGDVPDKCWD